MRYLYLTLIVLSLQSCYTAKLVSDSDKDGVVDETIDDSEYSRYAYENYSTILAQESSSTADKLNFLHGIDDRITLGERKKLLPEIINLFSPENFDCGCHPKLKKALKEKNYVPSVIQKQIARIDSVNVVDGKGANGLVHLVELFEPNGAYIKEIYVDNSPTILTFKPLEYLDTAEGTSNNFYYSVDCNGYINGALGIELKVSKQELQSSASTAYSRKESLVFIKGRLKSPLYQAYVNEGIFKYNDSLRLEVLKSIHNKIPPDFDNNVRIKIADNYLVIIASNQGSSNYNGEAKLSASTGISIPIGAVSGSVNAEATISRSSTFSNYQTYIIKENDGAIPWIITYKNLKDKIAELQTAMGH